MTSLPYWIDSALRPTFALTWMVLGLGLPWVLALLPRREWRNRALVALVMIGVGPMLLTAWMFVLGTVGGASETPLLTSANILLGTVPIALAGAGLALRKSRTAATVPAQRQPFALDERLLITVIVAACVLRWLSAVWYPFWEYDPLWVYGYEGKLYTLLGYIPQHIGYYPQFLPLQYAYAQIMTGGVDDHAARAVFPLFHWGSILAAYALGRLNLSRRAGVYMAALWAMYPHVGQWATVGDLEIPLTFATTAAAAFFLYAWRGAYAGESVAPSLPAAARPNRASRLRALMSEFWSGPAALSPNLRSYAIVSGLFLGLALWTKPTGGALILGVMILLTADLVRVRFAWRKWLPRFQVALWCGAASVPLGAVWYIRNVLLGHRAIDFPHPFWLTQAMRSGVEFGWPVLAAGLLCAWLLWGKGLRFRPNRRRLMIAWIVFAAGLLPSVLYPHRIGQIPWQSVPAWLGAAEWGLIIAGAGALLVELWPVYAYHATSQAKRDANAVGWGLLLALPYFVVWFMSYSYHYRLSFAIVPLMMLPTAAILARWIPAQRPTGPKPVIAPLIGIPLLVACLPGLVVPLYHYEGGWNYLWSNEYPDDSRRLDSTNPALSRTVRRLRTDIAEQGIERPVIFAPGLQRLPFFFPLDDVRITETPTDLDQLRGVDYYVYTQEARWLYEENDQPEVNPVTGSMYRPELMQFIGGATDPSFFSQIYRVGDIDARYEPPPNLDAPPVRVAWPWAELAGTRLHNGRSLGGDRVPRLLISFLALGPASLEYTLYIHLISPGGALVTTWDSLPAAGAYAWYSTRLWEPGEVVTHRTALLLPEGIVLEPGAEYTLRIGWYDYFEDNARVPAQIGSDQEADGFELPYVLTAAD